MKCNNPICPIVYHYSLLLENIIVRVISSWGSLMARNSQVKLVTLYAAETTQPPSVPLMVNCEP